MEATQAKPGQNRKVSMFEWKPLEQINSTYFPQRERLEKELEEAKSDAEWWAKSFDKCYEDLCDLKDQIELLKNENLVLLDELMWLRARFLDGLENLEKDNEEDFEEETLEGEEVEPLLQSECEDDRGYERERVT